MVAHSYGAKPPSNNEEPPPTPTRTGTSPRWRRRSQMQRLRTVWVCASVLFLAVLGPRCCVGFSLDAARAPTVTASLAAVLGLQYCCQSLRRVQLSVTPQTVARQAPLSMGFSRQEHWSGLPCPSPCQPRDRSCVSYICIGRWFLCH